MHEIPQIGSTLPDLGGERLGGGELRLDQALEGRSGLLLVFWSSACSHCQRYDQRLRRLATDPSRIALILVACRRQESAEALTRCLAQRDLPLEVWHDQEAEVAARLAIRQTPTALLLDPARRLLYRGAIDNFRLPSDPGHVDYLGPALDAFFAGRTLPRSQTPAFGCPVSSPYYES